MKAVAAPRFTVCSFNIECESENGEGGPDSPEP